MTSVSSGKNDKNGGGETSVISKLTKFIIDFISVIQRSNRKYLALCFIVPSAVMLGIYFAMGVYPVGDNSVLVLDLNGQYVYFFEELREIIHGDKSLLYSFGRALGGEFMGIFAYYLSSPFSFIVALFPKEMITEALLCMFILKTGLCGLTFGIYLEATRKRNRTAAVIFSAMYALTAYAVVMQHNTMWIDNIIFLPLIALGVERLIKYGKIKLAVIPLALAVISNFYIGYMTCIFTGAYFFYYYFITNEKDENGFRQSNPYGESKHFIKSLLRIAVAATLVIAISSIIILPAYYSLTFGKSTFSNPKYDFTQNFDFLDLMSKFFIGSYDTVRPEGWPFVYCGILTLILAPMYFISSRIKPREKIVSGVFLVFFILSFNGSLIDLFWHGMQRPNWLNYRYSFMFNFILLVLAYKAFEKITETELKRIPAVCGVIAITLMILQKLEYENLPDLFGVWLSLAFIGIYALILRLVKRGSAKKTAMIVLAIAVSLEMFAAGLLNLTDLGDDVVYSSRVSYRSFIDRVLPVADMINERDASFFRMEKTFHRKTNDNLALGMRGLSNSTSTLNMKTIELLNKLGLSSKSHWTKYLGGTPVLDSLLGLKYIMAEQYTPMPPFYNEMYTYNSDITVYENPYALPIAYGVDSAVLDLDFSEVASSMVRMNSLVAAMLGKADVLGEADTKEIFVPVPLYNIAYENCQTSFTTGHIKYMPTIAGKTTKIIFTVEPATSGLVYCYFPSDYPREVKLTLNGSNYDTFYGNETFRILCLGYYEQGAEITLSMTLEKEELYIKDEATFFYTIDPDAFESSMTALSDSTFEIEEFTEDSFSGNITVSEGKELIFTSIPFDDGWVVKVDGQKVPNETALDSLLAFTVPAGDHTLEMKYRPDSVTHGLALSAIGLVFFVLMGVFEPLKIGKPEPKKQSEEIE